MQEALLQLVLTDLNSVSDISYLLVSNHLEKVLHQLSSKHLEGNLDFREKLLQLLIPFLNFLIFWNDFNSSTP